MAALLKRMLQASAPCETRIENRAWQLRRTVRALQVDLVVTDLMMPGLSGFEVIRAKKWIRPYYTKDTHLLGKVCKTPQDRLPSRL